MIWEKKIRVIAMLTKEVEKGVVRCIATLFDGVELSKLSMLAEMCALLAELRLSDL